MAIELDERDYEAARRTMVDCQVRPSDVTDVALIDAMLWAPRERFMPKAKRAQAYVGAHVEIAPGRFELDPRDFAKMIDAAQPRREDLALVVGGGYGYAAAVLSRLCAAVVSLEVDASLASTSAQILNDVGADNVMVVEGALTLGCPAHSPYNVIVVNGAVTSIRALEFVEQLAEGGRLAAIEMSGPTGRCQLGVKSVAGFAARPVFDATAPIAPGFEREIEFVF